jgi:hypothetical protein
MSRDLRTPCPAGREGVEQAGVASVTFFIQRFQPDVRAWLAEADGREVGRVLAEAQRQIDAKRAGCS